MKIAQNSFPNNNGRLAYSVNEAAAVIGISRAKIYELMTTGQLPYAYCGKRRRILRTAIEKMLGA